MSDESILSLVVDTAGVSKGVSAANGLLAGLNSTALGVAASVAAVGAALAAFSYKALDAYAESEAATASLTAALMRNGEAAAGVVPILQDYASELQKLTVYEDDFIVTQMAQLKNFGLQTGQIKDATKAAMGLAQAYKMSLSEAIALVGKASAGEFGTLARHTIVLKSTGSDQEKFNELLKLGADAFQLAEAQAATFTGRLAQMWNALGNALEPFGMMIMNGLRLKDVMAFITMAVSSATKQIEAVIPAMGQMIVQVFGLSNSFADITGWLQKYIIPYIGDALVVAVGVAAGAISVFRTAWNTLTIGIRGAILGIVEYIGWFVDKVIWLGKQFSATRSTAEELEAGMKGFKDALKSDISGDADDIRKSIEGIGKAATMTSGILGSDLAKPLADVKKDLPGGGMGAQAAISKPQEAKFAGLALQGSVEAYKAEISRVGADDQIASNTAQTAQNTGRIARALERQNAESYALGTV